MNKFLLPLIFIVSIFIHGCASVEKIDDKLGAKALYEKANTALQNGNFQIAIEHFEKLEITYPFGIYAKQSQLEIAFAYYRFNESESATAAADRYIKLYPRSPDVDYAYYIKGLANFDKTSDSFDNLLGSDPATRDPKSARDSYQSFSELITRFPDSRYSDDALQRMIHLRNYLARHEVHVARYYLERKAYIAAATRAKFIIENYTQTPSTAEALSIMATAYEELEITDLQQDTLRILELNYPDYQAPVPDENNS